jgi:hypothetical protein
MSTLRYLFISFAVSVVSALMTIQTSLAQPLDLSGEWDTSYGTLVLSPTSDGFEGPYSSDNGRLRLVYTVDGTYEGEWSEDSSAQRCAEPSSLGGSYFWGRLKGEIPERREPFTLSWSYCDTDDYGNSWTFTPPGPSTPDPETPPVSAEGNWIAEWADSPEPPGLISIFQEYRWDCANPADSWCQKRITGPLILQGAQADPNDTSHPSGSVSISSNQLAIEWGYRHFGEWGGASVLTQSGNDSLTGEWSGAGMNGQEVWRRVRSSVAAAAAIVEFDGQFVSGPVKPLGQPVRLIADYEDETFRLRGNRKSVYLDLFGSNMWGHHETFLPRETGIEILGRFYICADRQIVSLSSQNTSCLEQGGVIGMRLELLPWPQATPGLKYLTFDGQSVPFNFELRNYPTPFQYEPSQTVISRVVLLDDQLGQRREPGDRAKNYSYPYDTNGNETGGLKSRLLAVIGKNVDLNGETYLHSGDPRITYRRIAVPPNIRSAISSAAVSVSGVPLAEGEQVVPVRAELAAGVQGGYKGIRINGQTKAWPLAFAGLGHVRFLRTGTTPNDTPENVFYFGETIRLGLRAYDDNYPTDNLKFHLEAVKQTPNSAAPEVRRLGPLLLRKTEDIQRGQNFAVSQPLLINREGRTPPPANDAIEPEQRIDLREGEQLVARPVQPFAVITLPPIARAEIIAGPRRSRLWQEALNRVSACRGLGGDATDPAFAREPSTVYSNWILTDGSIRRTTVTKGDHAALILIRDDLVPVIKAANEALGEHIADGARGRTLAQRYWSVAKSDPNARQNAFWMGRKHSIERSQLLAGRRITRTIEFRLSETFDVDALRSKLGMRNRVETQDLINDVIAKALKAQREESRLAIDRAERAYDCKVDELLAVAGRAAPAAFRSLMPDLVIEENGRWRPDVQARGYVRTAHDLGQTIRDQKDYAQIDNAYKSMALAIAALPGSAAGAWLASSSNATIATLGTAAATSALAVDAADLAIFGLEGINEYKQGEKDYFTTLGLAPFVEVDLLDEASRQRSSAAAAAVGVAAPILGGLTGLSALDDIRRINRGRALVRDGNALQRLDQLSDAQKLDVAAYYKNLKDADAGKTSVLSELEEADFRALQAIEDSAAARSDPSAYSSDSFLDLNIGGPARQDPVYDPGVPVRVREDSIDAAPPGSTIEVAPPGATPANDIRVAESYLDPEELWKLGPNERFAYPYRSKFGSSGGPSDGTVLTDGTALPGGAEIKLNNGETLNLGELVGEGGFRRVYVDPEDGSAVYKVTSYQDAWRKHELDPEDLNRFLHDTDVGRELLTAMSKDSSDALFRVAGQRQAPIVVDDPFNPARKFVITREDNIADTVTVRNSDGRLEEHTVTNAAERFSYRPSGTANEAERLTVQLAIRKLNQRGVVWTDNKLTNLDVIADASSPTGYKVVFFDYDGFRIAEGATEHQRYLNARRTQQVVSSIKEGQDLFRQFSVNDLPEFDHTIFGRRMNTPHTIDPYKNYPEFTRLDGLSPEEFGAVIRQFENSTGRNVPFSPPPPPPN